MISNGGDDGCGLSITVSLVSLVIGGEFAMIIVSLVTSDEFGNDDGEFGDW